MTAKRKIQPPPPHASLERSGADLYPVMLTPFTKEGAVDFESLLRLIRWYEEGGATGFFAACLSSEMFHLSIDERMAVARFTKEHTKLPVVASGHVGGDVETQLDDVRLMATTGVDAVVLVSNAFGDGNASDSDLIRSLSRFLERLEISTPLGIYECPVPHSQLLGDAVIEFIIGTDRFIFLKDTCCDIERIRRRLRLIEGTRFKLYNAHAQTLVESLAYGAEGYSGVQANCSIKLLSQICSRFGERNEIVEDLDLLYRVAKFCPENHYPICAKAILKSRGVLRSIHTRSIGGHAFGAENRATTEAILDDLLAFERRIKNA